MRVIVLSHQIDIGYFGEVSLLARRSLQIGRRTRELARFAPVGGNRWSPTGRGWCGCEIGDLKQRRVHGSEGHGVRRYGDRYGHHRRQGDECGGQADRRTDTLHRYLGESGEWQVAVRRQS
jgi:hypothetical protein